ncbi:cytochrome P450 [Gloeophyllum trabeum ATCC 11539]|uniref:Cytochrome P450 n=1 Tax=Gloeophyllum trabeum (strain ATCC 11539 / FP-39264 / Madison 617) TaxID=670483 RepID=S7RAP2_GLOTA|nr:cytochrome P450 [Gloeophyllum trabeum ATCC 11539]EPQ51330.1 cytochrome P450 [Gloeophyllum trabeum ATCC 11539]
MPYGERWRKERRTFHQHFHQGVVDRYQPTQIREARRCLNRLLADPDDFLHHLRHTFAAAVMNIAYGIDVLTKDDPYITTAEIAIGSLSESSVPGAFLVNQIPILKYVPTWFPGAGFKKKADYWRQVSDDMLNKPFETVLENMASNRGTAVPSVTSKMLQDLPVEGDNTDQFELIKHIGAAAYSGNSDTNLFQTVSAVQMFFLAMAKYPQVQARAQAELDEVVGSSRLPEFSDRPRLPYINAIIMETLRWQPVTPLAFPHCSTEDDEYKGYFIPKGSVLFGNTWYILAILHDPEAYPEPERFMPERFLKDGKINANASDPGVAAFGFGRRICPGRFLSDRAMFSVISSVLAVFNITPPLDERGKPKALEPAMTRGIVRNVVPFHCIVRPRSSAAAALIRAHGE